MDVTSATAATTTTATSSSSSGSTISSDFETFLKMLTTQIQNQDPLSPMQSEEFAVQLATFSSVEQQVMTNDLLTSLGTQMSVLGMAQLAGWVGMEARAAAPAWFDGSPVSVSPNPAAQAEQAYLVVRDSTGAEVQRLSIPVSSETLDWAGVDDNGTPFAAGLYSFEVESYDASGTLMSTDTADVYATIAEARGENGETILVLDGGVEIAAGDVTALRRADGGG